MFRCGSGRCRCRSRCICCWLRSLTSLPRYLVTLVLQVVRRVVTRHLLDRKGHAGGAGIGGAATLIQRSGSAANLGIHVHCLLRDGVYLGRGDCRPTFVEVAAPTDDVTTSCTRRCERSSPG